MKTLALILIAAATFGSRIIYAQGCLPEGITFTTQSEIDNFQANYPGCTEIEGDVNIQGLNISNINGLWVLQAIYGSLTIGGEENLSTSLTDLQGLYYLTTIERNLSVENNPYLISLTGLENLDPESIDTLTIYSNPSLFLCDVASICSYLEIPGAQAYIANNNPDCDSPFNVLIDCGNNCLPDGIIFSTQQQIDNFQTNYPGCSEITGIITIQGNNISNLQGLNVITTMHNRLLIGELYPTPCNLNLHNLSGLENLTYIGGFLGLEWSTSLQNCIGLNNLQQVRGYLTICGIGNLTSLEGLENLTSIGYSLGISNTGLQNMSGLDNLSSIGDNLSISYCPGLQNLTGLSSLTNVGGKIIISNNNYIPELTGFCSNNQLTIGSKEIYIVDNSSLQVCGIPLICDLLSDTTVNVAINNNAPGCDNPEQVIESCHSCLTNGIIFSTQDQIDSFQFKHPDCWNIKGNVLISGNNISNLNGLNGIVKIEGNLEILNNENLSHLTGLASLTTVWGNIVVGYNEILSDFTGFENLTNIGEYLSIEGNEHLISLKGLYSISPNSVYYLHIVYNPLLTKCDVNSICEYLLTQGYADIYDNAPGCNSPEEVMELCITSITEKTEKDELTLMPNPAASFITLTTPGDLPIEEVVIYNHLGQKVLNAKQVNNTVDVLGLKAGMYLIEVSTKDRTERTKFVKN